MFEHVGLANLSGYNATVCRVLRPGGLFMNHGITHDEEGRQPTLATEFINRYVFPDGELDTSSNIVHDMEHAGFEIHDVETMRPHYALTFQHWVRWLEAAHDEALQYVAIRQRDDYCLWRLYMAACALEFEAEGDGHLPDPGIKARDDPTSFAAHASRPVPIALLFLSVHGMSAKFSPEPSAAV